MGEQGLEFRLDGLGAEVTMTGVETPGLASADHPVVLEPQLEMLHH